MANTVVAPGLIPYALSHRCWLALCEMKDIKVPADLSADFLEGANEFSGHEDCRKTATMLCETEGEAIIILGQSAISHPMYSCIDRLAQLIGEISGAQLAVLPPANSAAGWIAGCLPNRSANGTEVENPGFNARQMIHNPRPAYLLFNIETIQGHGRWHACCRSNGERPASWSVFNRLRMFRTMSMWSYRSHRLQRMPAPTSIAKDGCSIQLQRLSRWARRAPGLENPSGAGQSVRSARIRLCKRSKIFVGSPSRKSN